MAKLLYQGHASIRITTDDNTVLYVDPFAGAGYETPADIILVTHQHGDHNQTDLAAKKADCVIITNKEAVQIDSGLIKHNTFQLGEIKIVAVEAKNKNHNPNECVGYIIFADDLAIYIAGDTSKTEQMKTLADIKIDYALLPCDGIYNMDVKEASECADLIGARHSIPIHMKPKALFDKETAESFTGLNSLILEPGTEINL